MKKVAFQVGDQSTVRDEIGNPLIFSKSRANFSEIKRFLKMSRAIAEKYKFEEKDIPIVISEVRSIKRKNDCD